MKTKTHKAYKVVSKIGDNLKSALYYSLPRAVTDNVTYELGKTTKAPANSNLFVFTSLETARLYRGSNTYQEIYEVKATNLKKKGFWFAAPYYMEQWTSLKEFNKWLVKAEAKWNKCALCSSIKLIKKVENES